jgi:hypothetical protein
MALVPDDKALSGRPCHRVYRIGVAICRTTCASVRALRHTVQPLSQQLNSFVQTERTGMCG